MSGAARKLERKKKKQLKDGPGIKLGNPAEQLFEQFIFGNALHCDDVVEVDSATGQHLILCGAGPSLREHAAEWCPQGDQVWGCNSALTWLHDNGHNPTHGFAIDQTSAMLNEWASLPDVEYLIASTVHCHLTEFLIENERRIRFFNNYVGIKKPPVQYDGRTMSYEDWMYAGLYPATVRAGSGLNSVTRAIDVGRFMNFSRITVLGADCALRARSRPPEGMEHGTQEHLTWLENETEMHADGGSAVASGATMHTMSGEIDGRWWDTKPDMMISAVWLVRMGRSLGPGFQMIGDTLPNALKDKPDAFLDQLPTLVYDDGSPIKYATDSEPLDALES